MDGNTSEQLEYAAKIKKGQRSVENSTKHQVSYLPSYKL